MVKHGARRHQIKISRLDWSGDDVSLAKLETRRARVDERQTEIHCHGSPAGSDSLGEPSRHGAVTTPDFERPRPRPNAQPFDLAPVHRIE
jgi:hypothetical protein